MPEKLRKAPEAEHVTAAAASALPATHVKPTGPAETIFDVQNVNVFYGTHKAVADVNLKLPHRQITALIGPSGCGKSTFIRCLNRMNDLIPSARVDGLDRLPRSGPLRRRHRRVQVRKRIGMVFQKPNPFPKSIYDNIAFGPRLLGVKGNMDEIVERALRRGAVWDEVKDRLKTNAFGHVGRPAAAPVHRACARHRARRAADGRAVLGA